MSDRPVALSYQHSCQPVLLPTKACSISITRSLLFSAVAFLPSVDPMAQLRPSLLRLPNASVNQQRIRSCAFKPATRCIPAMAVQHSSRTDQQTAATSTSSSSSECGWRQALPAAVLLPLLSAGAAFADDAAVDAAYAAAYAQDTGATNTIVTVLATFVFVLLVLVTGGVSRSSSSSSSMHY